MRVNAYRDAVNEFRRGFLERALAAHDGNRAHMAAALGMNIDYLRMLLTRFQIAGPGKPGRPRKAGA